MGKTPFPKDYWTYKHVSRKRDKRSRNKEILRYLQRFRKAVDSLRDVVLLELAPRHREKQGCFAGNFDSSSRAKRKALREF